MRKIIAALLLFVSCSQQPTYRTLQIDYIQDDKFKTTYVNVKEICPNHFEVVSQENIDPTPFVILRIFDYDLIDYE